MDQQVIGTVAGLEQRSGGWVAVSIMEPGKEYPKKLSTKKQELISQAQQMMGQVVTAGYNETESTNINPHNGQPYVNRFLEALAFGAVDLVGSPTQIQPQQYMPQPQQQQQAPQQQFQGQPQTFAGQQPAQPFVPQPPMPQAPLVPQPQISSGIEMQAIREAKIHRQTGTKVAVELLQYLTPDERNLASLVRISEQLVHYYEHGVQWTTPPVQAQAPQQQGGGSEYNPGYAAQPGAVPAQPQAQGYEQPSPDDDIPF